MSRHYPQGYAYEHGLGPEEEEAEEVRPTPSLAEIRAFYAEIEAHRQAVLARSETLQRMEGYRNTHLALGSMEPRRAA